MHEENIRNGSNNTKILNAKKQHFEHKKIENEKKKK